METIQPGDVVFYMQKGIIGGLISKITKSPYSHVALVIDETTVLEANRFITTRLADIDLSGREYHVYRVEGITEEQGVEAAIHAMEKLLNTRYDYLQLVGLFFRYVFHWDFLTLNHRNRWLCSEVIDYAYLTTGLKRTDFKHVMNISPQGIFEKYKLRRTL